VNIAQAIPNGTSLTSLSLPSGSTEPLQITAVVDSQTSAGVLRVSLVESEAFEAADILNISPGETNEATGEVTSYNVTMSATLTGSAEAEAKLKAAEAAAAEAAAAATAEGT